MRDSLKEYVDSSPEDFELYPFEGGWDKVAEKVAPAKKRPNHWLLGIAASLAILFISTVLVWSNSNTTQVPDEVAEMEGFYQEEINTKISLVKNQLGDDRILADLEAMDAAFAELKADLSENVDNEEVLMAMMENYRLKLQILEEILSELAIEKSEEDL